MGTDFSCPTGTPIRAIGDGVVRERLTATDFGRYISIDHPDGLRSRYGHLSEWSAVVGQIVLRGQVIALSGNTGTASTGPHLHLDCSYRTLAEAQQIQPDPVLHLGRYRIDPELLFIEEDDMFTGDDRTMLNQVRAHLERIRGPEDNSIIAMHLEAQAAAMEQAAKSLRADAAKQRADAAKPATL
jgi:hypothetical protein